MRSPNATPPPPSQMVGPLKIGIRWKENIDLDLYATPRRDAETLFFQHPRSPEGSISKKLVKMASLIFHRSASVTATGISVKKYRQPFAEGLQVEKMPPDEAGRALEIRQRRGTRQNAPSAAESIQVFRVAKVRVSIRNISSGSMAARRRSTWLTE
jgi:hypothetical protein